MRNKSIPELDKLFNEIGTYKKSDELKEVFVFIKKFPRIAPYNAMLLHVQRPGSNYVASASVWNNTFKRTIKPGAKPLVILRPFGPVAFVFELSDTEGETPFPEKLLNPFKVTGKISDSKFNRLIDNMLCDGIIYVEAEHGASSAGFVQINNSNKIAKITKSNKEIFVKILFNMVVNSTHERETHFATVLHELGHIYCGHLGTPNTKWWGDRRYLSKNEVEFEAKVYIYLRYN